MERRQLGRGVPAVRAGLGIAARDLLRTSPLFDGVEERTLDVLAERLRPVRYDAGVEVVREGDPGAQLFVIAEGEVDVVTADGVQTLGPGDFFGELAILGSGARTATVRTRAPSELYVLGRGDFTRLLEREPAVREAVRVALERRRATG